MAEESPCPVCGAPARHVVNGMPWCLEHAPAVTSPWILIGQVVAILGLLAALVVKLIRWALS